MRSLRTTRKSSPRSPQLEKARTQQQKPDAATKKKKKVLRNAHLQLPPEHQRPLVLEAWRSDGEPSSPPFVANCLATMDRVPGVTLVPAWSVSWKPLLTWWHLQFIKDPLTGTTQFSFCPASSIYSQPFSMAWIRGHLGNLVALTPLLISSPL